MRAFSALADQPLDTRADYERERAVLDAYADIVYAQRQKGWTRLGDFPIGEVSTSIVNTTDISFCLTPHPSNDTLYIIFYRESIQGLNVKGYTHTPCNFIAQQTDMLRLSLSQLLQRFLANKEEIFVLRWADGGRSVYHRPFALMLPDPADLQNTVVSVSDLTTAGRQSVVRVCGEFDE